MLVAGIGSPQQPDAVGWHLVDRIVDRFRGTASFSKPRVPMDLLELLPGQDALLVIDACRAGCTAGDVTRVEWPDSRLLDARDYSTHGWGLVATLRLSEEMDILPQRTTLILVEVGDDDDQTGLQGALARGEQAVVDLLTHEGLCECHA